MDGLTIWWAGVGLYILDSARACSGSPVLRYGLDGVGSCLRDPLLRVGGHALTIPNPLRPDVCEIPMEVRSGIVSPLNQTDRYLLERTGEIYLPHQIAAAGSFVSLFILIPILAHGTALVHAALAGLLVSNLFLAGHWLTLWRRRDLLGLTRKQIASDVAHCLFCPPNGPNSVRRMASLRRTRFDGMMVLATYSPMDAQTLGERMAWSGEVDDEEKPTTRDPARNVGKDDAGPTRTAVARRNNP